ncbi:hypothetical protein AYO38_10005 [bacterium SCGC AG-212-C10]|nr:hypothetical protein AYO38_10005 [bacterium SCGC AG-212-C10]
MRYWLSFALFLSVLLALVMLVAAFVAPGAGVWWAMVAVALYVVFVVLDLVPPGRQLHGPATPEHPALVTSEELGLPDSPDYVPGPLSRARLRSALPATNVLQSNTAPFSAAAAAPPAATTGAAVAAPGIRRRPPAFDRFMAVVVIGMVSVVALVLLFVRMVSGGGGNQVPGVSTNATETAGHATATPTASPEPTATHMPSPSPTPTATQSPTATSTPTSSSTPTRAPATATPTRTGTATQQPPAPLVSGTWEFRDTVTQGSDRGESFEFTVTLTESRGVITGSGDGLTFNGERIGNNVTLRFTRRGGSGLFVLRLQGDTMTGTFTDDGADNSGTAIARRDD